jgi:serine/threonine-protein kinase
MPLAIGAALGPYEILAPLGAGGIGEVWRGRDTRLAREVAIKVLPDRLSTDGAAVSRLEREAKAIAALSHPNILAVHDIGQHDGRLYVVMELLDGSSLRERIDVAEIGVPRSLDWALQIAQGLAAAHERGVVHRDLKPENVFITRDGIVKILDFGLALRSEGLVRSDAKTLTRGTIPGSVVGTIGYLSPEQARGEEADHRSDIFSFGVLLYELLTGRRAFHRANTADMVVAILREEPPPCSASGRAVPPEVEEIVRHCIEKVPSDRFRSARDLAFALKIAARSSSGSGNTSSTVRTQSETRAAPSIAVLPFRNLDRDPETQYFTDGMTEEIIGTLSRIQGLHVASRTSSFAFKGKDVDVRQIGSELGVETILEGSVRKARERLRVSAELVSVSTGWQLWSDQWDRDLADVFSVQEEIARAIASTLELRLGRGPMTAAEPRTRDIGAYDSFLKGRYLFQQRKLRAAIRELQSAVESDPHLAEAHMALADAWAILGFYGGIPTWEAWARARAAAECAEDLAPESPAVAVSFAILEHYYGWSNLREESFCRRALERDPEHAEGWFWLSLCLVSSGRTDEGAEAAEQGLRREPHSANLRAALAWSWIYNGNFDEARRELARAVEMDSGALFPLWTYGFALRHLGHHKDAIAAHERAVELSGADYSFYQAMLGCALVAGGREEEARRILAELQDRASYSPPLDRAQLLACLGEGAAALEALEQAYEERNAFLWARIHWADFDALREDPRFQDLVNRLARRAPVRKREASA